ARISHDIQSRPVDGRPLAAHFIAMALFLALSFVPRRAGLSGFEERVVVVLWFLAAGVGIILAVLLLVPFRFVSVLVRSTGSLWLLATAGAWISERLIWPAREMWANSLLDAPTSLTLRLVHTILHPFFPDLVVNPAQLSISSSHFTIVVLMACSGV